MKVDQYLLQVRYKCAYLTVRRLQKPIKTKIDLFLVDSGRMASLVGNSSRQLSRFEKRSEADLRLCFRLFFLFRFFFFPSRCLGHVG